MNEKREQLVCDTSFVGHFARAIQRPASYGRWGGPALGRVEAGEMAVSVVTIAEIQAGLLKANWGRRRLEEAGQHFDRYRRLPIRWEFAEEWARLRVVSRKRGIAIGDNDLWIAATANVRGHALVTCDRDHERIAPELGVEVVYLRPPV